MSKPGWYPDPGGRAGQLRYWDGKNWSATTSTNASDPPPSTAPAAAGGRVASGPSTISAATLSAFPDLEEKRTPAWAWLVGVALLIVVALIVWTGVSAVTGGGAKPKPGTVPSQDVCPRAALGNTGEPHPADGRVYGGKISFPEQPAPWRAPRFEPRLPFGFDAREQSVLLEQNYDGRGSDWVASVLVADLVAGDGFYAPKKGTEMIAHCVLGTFYGDAVVHRQDLVSKPVKIDGYDAYQLEMHLTFDIPNLRTKGETAIIIVAATGTSSASLYYASIPDTAPDLLPVARSLVSQLRID